MVTNWVQVGIGVWLILSPWLLQFSSISIMKWNNLLLGLILVLINIWIIFGENEKRS